MKTCQETDQLSRQIEIDKSVPLRIISLVPSQTELLFDLGLDEEVVGITKFCVHPKDKVRLKTKVGGTKKLDIEKIKALNPTLIIANKEENVKEQIEELAQYYPVWISDVTDLPGALDMITSVGRMTRKEKEAELFCTTISEKFTLLEKQFSAPSAPLPADRHGLRDTHSTAYLIWRNPYMVAGSATFINDMLQRSGFKNCFQSLAGHYPEITAAQLQEADPKFILLSSEPFPFKEKHIAEFQKICPEAKIMLVDGEMFSWYGSRLALAPAYFLKLAENLW